jgi:hypothetical protein
MKRRLTIVVEVPEEARGGIEVHSVILRAYGLSSVRLSRLSEWEANVISARETTTGAT